MLKWLGICFLLLIVILPAGAQTYQSEFSGPSIDSTLRFAKDSTVFHRAGSTGYFRSTVTKLDLRGSGKTVLFDSAYIRSAMADSAVITLAKLDSAYARTLVAGKIRSTGIIMGDSSYARTQLVETIRSNGLIAGDSLHGRTAHFTGDLTYNLVHAHVALDTTTYTPSVSQNTYTLIHPTMAVNETTNVFFAADTMKVLVAGDYFTIVALTIVGSNGDDYKVGIFKNGVRLFSVVTTTTGATNYQSVALHFFLKSLVVNDGLSLKVTNLTNSNDPTFKGISWYVRKESN